MRHMLIAAVKKATEWPTDFPFLNDVIAAFVAWIAYKATLECLT